MRLIGEENARQIGRNSFAGTSFDSVARFVSRVFRRFKYAYVKFLKLPCNSSLPNLMSLLLWLTRLKTNRLVELGCN